MKKYFLFSLILFSLILFSIGQPITSSNLPILIIDTEGATIVDEPKVKANLSVIYQGAGITNFVTDVPSHYQGPIGIEYRGSSSQFLFDKKGYGIEFRKPDGLDSSGSVFGFPAEEDWVLNGPYSDKTLIRNILAYHLWEQTGRYGPRNIPVELLVNSNYEGVYVWMEKIKRDSNRVAISKLTALENTGDDLTGGYLVKLDKFDGSNSGGGWASPIEPPRKQRDDQVIYFQYDYPKGRDITQSQKAYIETYVTAFEHALASPGFKDPLTGYRQYADVSSFIDLALLNEISRNVDGYRLSTFLQKEKDSKGGKLAVATVWDFNLAFGNANYCEGWNEEGWAWDFNEYCSHDFWLIPFWWRRFLQDPQYVADLKNRWNTLRTGPFQTDRLLNYIDSMAQVLDEPQARNFTRWPVLGQWVWPNPEDHIGLTYQQEIDYLKMWLSARLDWLDTNINLLEAQTPMGLNDGIASLTVYPNPVSQEFRILSRNSVLDIRLYDMNGRTMKHWTQAQEGYEVALLKPGLYVLAVRFEDQSEVKYLLRKE
ncbi:MAG: CotH kinase family protein [Cyclobacteriaceae bacterium]|nr:CotH kinase family protein [Cyclobacteriaceae bacterium]